jgi:exopolyphosphatase/pppGpp-phosphohydrolase
VRGAAAPHVAAAIDIGSNSIHLLVARQEAGRIVPLLDASVQLGLGDAVDRHGHIPADGHEALVAAVKAYVAEARGLGAREVALLGTEPLRRAGNRSVIEADVLAVTGLPLVVLSLELEAQLTLLGVLGPRPPAEPTLVVDVGGGSTEVILARPGLPPLVAALPTGSSRLTAAVVRHDPPTDAELAELRSEAALLMERLPRGSPARGIVVGGSGTNLWRMGDGRPVPGPPTLDPRRLERAVRRLAARPAATLARSHALTERRVGQMAAGAALVEAIMAHYGLAQLEVSDASLREGAILAVEAAGEGWPGRLSDLVSGSL